MKDPREGNGVKLLPETNSVLCLGETKTLCEQRMVSWIMVHCVRL